MGSCTSSKKPVTKQPIDKPVFKQAPAEKAITFQDTTVQPPQITTTPVVTHQIEELKETQIKVPTTESVKIRKEDIPLPKNKRQLPKSKPKEQTSVMDDISFVPQDEPANEFTPFDEKYNFEEQQEFNEISHFHSTNEVLYSVSDLVINDYNEYSTEDDWHKVLKMAKTISTNLLASKILALPERRWQKENSLLTDVSL